MVNVSWSPSPNATYYEAYRATDASGPKDKIVSVGVLTYNDASAKQGIYYYYWVTACNAGGCSDLSEYDIGYLKVVTGGGPAISPILMLLLD